MRSQKPKTKPSRPRPGKTKQRALKAAFVAAVVAPYGKHPVYLWLRTLEEQAGRLLVKKGLPGDLPGLMSHADNLPAAAARLCSVLWQAERVREAIRTGDPEATGLHSMRLMAAATRAGVSLKMSRAGKSDRKPMGILHAIRHEIEENAPPSPEKLWEEHLEQRHYGFLNSIPIDEPDFSGEVFFEDGRLVQEPAADPARTRAIGYKRFMVYYYSIVSSPA